MSSEFEVPNRFEIAYRRAISKLIGREIPAGLSADNIDEWLDRLSSISSDQGFISDSSKIALSMVRDINIYNTLQWKDVARGSSKGSKIIKSLHETKKGSIGKAIKSQIEKSSNYISSVPAKIAEKLRKEANYARELGATETGVYNIISSRFERLLIQKVLLLAQTDPHRTNSAFTEARSEDLDINCFIWTIFKDHRVRYSHRKMSGIVVFWRELPSPEILVGLPGGLGYYSPGNCPNCRCTAIPVLSIYDLFKTDRQTIRVYIDGQIKRLTKAQFLQIL